MNFTWQIASRYIWNGRREAFVRVITIFSFLGICLGVATLIIVMSVMNGFRHELLDKTLKFNSHLTIHIPDTEDGSYEEITQEIRKIPEIISATKLINRQAMFTIKGNARGVSARAIQYEDFQNKEIISENILAGSLKSIRQANSILIGQRLAEKFRLSVGDKISLISPDGNIGPFGMMPRMKTFVVGGIYEVGMYQYDMNVVYLPYSTAKEFYKLEKDADEVEIYLKDPFLTDYVIAKVQEKISKPLKFIGWNRAHSSFFQAVKIERNVMFLILSLIIIIAAFNVISGLIMIVKDKTQDIAILRTMGASRRSILGLFLIVGSSVGVIGSTLGTIIGLVFCNNIEYIRKLLEKVTGQTIFDAEIYYLSQLPVIVESQEVIGIVTMALTISFLATLYPAWKAANLEPVKALRYD
jgi:lipoprotein-releasing system permease protein